jgi:hypothetical protein
VEALAQAHSTYNSLTVPLLAVSASPLGSVDVPPHPVANKVMVNKAIKAISFLLFLNID